MFYDYLCNIIKRPFLKKNISILGCGWLGFPLAVRLIALGWQVKGSTTTEAKLLLLRSNQIDPYLVQLDDGLLQKSGFFGSDTLLINIPPGLRRQSVETYLNQMQALADRVEQSPVKQVIFISATSVYEDSNSEVIRTDVADTESPLYQSEVFFTDNAKFNTTVIRLAGLIGPGRNPARFFSGKTDVPNGRAPVNLIHLDDCIGIIQSVLDQQKFGATYHAAAPAHPSRMAFYTEASRAAGLPLPVFIDELKEWKIIDPEKLEHELRYQFIHPDLLQSLDNRSLW